MYHVGDLTALDCAIKYGGMSTISGDPKNTLRAAIVGGIAVVLAAIIAGVFTILDDSKAGGGKEERQDASAKAYSIDGDGNVIFGDITGDDSRISVNGKK